MTAGANIDQLAPVGLDDLLASAELLSRVDRKYVLPAADLDVLLAGSGPGTRVLDIEGRRSFGYRSVYFDTPALDSYLSTARRRRQRIKIRTRSYLDTGLQVLEVKTRGARGLTIKQRLAYDGDGWGLTVDDRHRLATIFVDLGVRLDPAQLRPVLITRYRRSTFLPAGWGSRMTVDTGLSWSLTGSPAGSLRTPRAIVETKSPGRAGTVDRLLWSLGHRPAAISKFGTGLAALRPDLPANRWHPMLHRRLDLCPDHLIESDF